jgi:hypothetical protein
MLYLHLSFKDLTCTTVTLVSWLLNPKAHSQIHLFFNFYNYHQDSFFNVDARSTISVPASQELLCSCIFFQVLSVLVKWNQHMNWHRTGIRKCRSFQFRLESDPLITICFVWPVFHASPKDWKQGLDTTTQDPNRPGLLTFQPEP